MTMIHRYERRAARFFLIASPTLFLLIVLALLVLPPAKRPCPTEDSVSCYWDADQQGNGRGASFTVDEHGNRTYWSGK